MSAGQRQFADVLREPGFRGIVLVRLAGQSGDGAFQAGLAAFALFSPEHAPSAIAIAAGFAVLLLPYTFLGPVAGVMLDRWSRRRVLVLTNALRAVILLALSAMLLAGRFGVVFVALALLALAANRLILAALGASLPHLVPGRLLVPANGLAPTIGTVAYVVGTGVGAVINGAPALVVAAILYVLSASLSLLMPWLGPDLAAGGSAITELRALARATVEVRHHLTTRAATALATITALRLPFGVLLVMVLVVERYAAHGGRAAISGLTVILGSAGVGFAVAALVTPPLVTRLGLARTVTTMLVAAAVSTLVGLPLTLPTMTAAAFLIAWTTQGVKICVDTVIQRDVADIYRGRVFTWYDILFNCGFVLATVLAALVLPPDGRSSAVLVALALSYLVIAVAVRPGWRGRPAAVTAA